MLSWMQLQDIICDIEANYQGIDFEIFTGGAEGAWWVQVGTFRADCNTGDVEIGKGGKAYVSPHATDDEVVKKIFGLCMAYVEHEMREGFYYKGKRLFGPHISLEALMDAANKTTVRT